MRIFALLFVFLVVVVPTSIGVASAQTEMVPQSRGQVTLTFAPLVKQAAPAVVNIYARKLIQQRVSPLFEDPFFHQFFQGALPPGFSRQRLENSLGSGVIVRADGLIVTSNHVISGADQIRVVLSDRREFDAVVVATDEHSDLAVLRIDAKNLPHLDLKDSDEIEVGDLVLAIGNPFGVGKTVTSGIVSAVTHRAVGASDLDYFIQTDAAINPGNSGGALVTMDGKLVGINAAIYSQSGGNLGIGFAVPSNMVRVVLTAVEQGKKNIIRPWLGIEGQEVTAELAESMNMTQPTGVLVNGIHSASPAVKAGLHVGDVIVSVKGHPVEDMEAFRYRVATLPIGTTVDLEVMRKEQRLSLQMELIAPPENPPREATLVTGNNPLVGATLENLSPAVSEELGLHGIEHGVVIARLKESGFMADMGLQPGDVILSINGVKTTTVRDVLDAIKQRERSWRLSIQRGDNTLTMMVGG